MWRTMVHVFWNLEPLFEDLVVNRLFNEWNGFLIISATFVVPVMFIYHSFVPHKIP